MICFVSTGLLVHRYMDTIRGAQTYSQALALATSTSGGKRQTLTPVSAPQEKDPHMEEIAAIDLTALCRINADVAGWIRIPDTAIQYPLLKGQDNGFYLNHTWDGKKNAVGSIFFDKLCSEDLTDYHTIIYGHNMRDGSMFGELSSYSDPSFWQAHPYIYMATDTAVYRYEVFAAYKAGVNSKTYYLAFPKTEDREDFLDYIREKSVLQTGITPQTTDRILTLSTCTGVGYATRWVVHGRLDRIEPRTQENTA